MEMEQNADTYTTRGRFDCADARDATHATSKKSKRVFAHKWMLT